MVARRRLLKAAVFRPQAEPGPAGTARTTAGLAPDDTGSQSVGFADVSQLPRTVSGTILDVSPHVLVLGDGGQEQRFALTPDAVAWRGAQLEPAALRQGDHAVVRLHPSAATLPTGSGPTSAG